ncbi:MAG: type III-B CRISPR module RAMP protein Cmr6 [Zoogloeaceae bacterium]|nr:type III-B CRISPR module RAMP protein Cmr6 [Zoogloeaceae bacterium]
MYLPLWGVDHGENGGQRHLLWETHDINYRHSGRNQELRAFRDENKTACLKAACALTPADKLVLESLVERQTALGKAAPNLLILDAQSVAPFSTGLGNEHPLENGFAFLNPYGLPYLPGSGVKGILRQVARELSSGEWGDSAGWSEDKHYALKIGKKEIWLSMLDVLFGYESANHEKEHVRGALSFWDVIPRLAGDRLAVDIMTPHQSHYYQNNPAAGSNTPHESGQPNPISFLTVPPKSRFVFHVDCDQTHLRRLAPELAENDRWRGLMTAAFQHAFEWLGFGAKTAVGYGAMRADMEAAEERRRAQAAQENAEKKRAQEAAEKARLATLPEWEKIRTQVLKEKTADQKDEDALLKALEEKRWPDADEARRIAEEVAQKLKDSKQWREKSEKKNPEKDKPFQKTQRVKRFLG